MNLAISATVFPVIFIAEFPDKTMIALLALSTQGRAFWVWLGGAIAFGTHVVIATTIGVALFRFLSPRTVDVVTAALFLAGSVLVGREALRHRHDPPPDPAGDPPPSRRWGLSLAAFTVIFLAEWGDLTQILTANLTARYHSPLSVGLGSLLALWTVAALAVLGGRGLLRLANMSTLRAGTALVLAGLAAYSAWAAFT